MKRITLAHSPSGRCAGRDVEESRSEMKRRFEKNLIDPLNDLPDSIEDALVHFDAMPFRSFVGSWTGYAADHLHHGVSVRSFLTFLNYVRERYREEMHPENAPAAPDLNSKQHQTAKRLYVEQGMSVREVAGVMKRGHQTVSKMLREMGVLRCNPGAAK